MRDARGERTSLAGTGAGDDEEAAVGARRDLTLAWVKIFKMARATLGRHLLVWTTDRDIAARPPTGRLTDLNLSTVEAIDRAIPPA